MIAVPKENLKAYQCKICEAHATGFHFDGQSCSACAAFFRRTVSLNRTYKCPGNNDCLVRYNERQLCRACRFTKCLNIGMKREAVQPKKMSNQNLRAYATKSGLKRNKRFAMANFIRIPPPIISEPSTSSDNLSNISDEEVSGISTPSYSSTSFAPPFIPPPTVPRPEPDIKLNALQYFIDEEMRITERRRIMFCERPVGSLLGASKSCPYDKEDIKPLSFRNFRKSIRTHILLIYEWLRAWPDYSSLSMKDQINFLRKCVLYHTVLDPCYITYQIGDPTKFVMQNGGYVSTLPDCDDGWDDEKDITRENKKRIYIPLLSRLMEIVAQISEMKLSFEEFVALKALVSFQATMYDISEGGRFLMKRQLDEIIRSLYDNYLSKEYEKSQRFGNIILMLSQIFDTGLNFVESHHQVQFFDLWQLDSLLLQFLRDKV
uniref:Uncharacterized protein n=1 Tax=Acrobeloides nanus TaxID=290746 RepID=A0A914C5F8_9BILA